MRAAIHDLEKDKPFLQAFEEEMEDFDSCLTKTLDVYLEYLKSFVMMIQADSSLLISTYQKNLLEQEWEFVKTTCPHIPGGEARYLIISRNANVYFSHIPEPVTPFVKWPVECCHP